MDDIEIEDIGPNLKVVQSPRGDDVRSLQDLIESCDIDLDVWQPLQPKFNKWPTTMKDADGEPLTVFNYQVKCSFVRRHPLIVEPLIRPLEIPRKYTTYRTTKKANSSGIKTALILPDPQFGFSRDLDNGKLSTFHDMRALDIAVQVAADLRPHQVVHLGDVLDLPDWSDKFVRSPTTDNTTQLSVVAASWWLGLVKSVSQRSVSVVLEGNHDKRMELALQKHLKAACNLRPADELALPPSLSVPRLLALHKLGIQYHGAYPNGEYWLANNFLCKHGDIVRGESGGSAKAAVSKHDVNVIFGHIHRIESAMRTTFDMHGTRTIGAYSCGCLCRVDGAVPGKSARQNWQQGFAVVHYEERTGWASVQLIEIQNGRAMLGGKMYVGEDRSREMYETTGYEGFKELL